MKHLIYIFALLFFGIATAQSDGSDPEDITADLADMQGGYAFGNPCGEGTYMECNVYADMNMNFHTLVIRHVSITVHGNVINEGTIIFECDESILTILGETLNVDTEADFSVKIYPNPATNYLNVKASNLKHITISDITGRVLKRYTTIVDNNIINVQNLSKGVYFVLLQDNSNRQEVVKFIKQ